MIKRIYDDKKQSKTQHLKITANTINKSPKGYQQKELVVSLYEAPSSSLSYSDHKNNRNKHSSSHNRASRKQFAVEYERKIQNSRILKRILYPKRDKMIMNSTKMLGTNSDFGFFARTEPSHLKRNPLKDSNADSDQNNKNYNKEKHRIQVQNYRMAKRIIDVKPFSSGKKNPRSKLLNQGIKSFMDYQDEKEKYSQENIELPIKTISLNSLKSIYGFGPTIIEITSFQLHCVPALKNDDLISLELMPSEKLFNSKQPVKNNSRYTTPGVQYKLISNHSIKFAVRMKNIGEFVPLKIWKFEGIEVINMGIFDIHFGNYVGQKTEKREKYFFTSKIDKENESFLRKEKNQESGNSIRIEYKIYSRKYV